MPTLKPGFMTSEYWVTVITALLSLLAAAGVIGPTDAQPLVENVKTVIFGLYSLLAILSYIHGRVELKKNL